MSKTIVTNQEIQEQVSKSLRSLDEPTANLEKAKSLYRGAKTILQSVRLDMDKAIRHGQPFFKRTEEFFKEQ